MSKCDWGCDLKEKVDEFAQRSAKTCGRGAANIEDQIRAAMQLQGGLAVMGSRRAAVWKAQIDKQLKRFMASILQSERSIRDADAEHKAKAEDLLVSFLLSFASRTATRERLNVFTTNYDRVIEYACDLAGLHVLDRFVGALAPVFRATRLNVDVHYNPPGIRGEPRYLEGVNLRGLLKELPSLPSRQAVLLGWATPIPTLVEISELPENHRPRSSDPEFWNVWTGKKDRPINWHEIVTDWTGIQTEPGISPVPTSGDEEG